MLLEFCLEVEVYWVTPLFSDRMWNSSSLEPSSCMIRATFLPVMMCYLLPAVRPFHAFPAFGSAKIITNRINQIE